MSYLMPFSCSQTLKDFFLKISDTNWITFGIGLSAIAVQVINNEFIKVSLPNLNRN